MFNALYKLKTHIADSKPDPWIADGIDAVLGIVGFGAGLGGTTSVAKGIKLIIDIIGLNKKIDKVGTSWR